MKITTGLRVLVGCAVSIGAFGCSSGGGGDSEDFVGAATARVRISPSKIDTGDRTRVVSILSDVNDNGVALKFRFPVELFYVPNSAKLVIDDKEIDASPTVNASDDQDSYLVFYFTQNQFSDDKKGIVTFDLEAADEVRDREVEVDADVDDPLIDNASEFNLDKPEFGAEDSASIEVAD